MGAAARGRLRAVAGHAHDRPTLFHIKEEPRGPAKLAGRFAGARYAPSCPASGITGPLPPSAASRGAKPSTSAAWATPISCRCRTSRRHTRSDKREAGKHSVELFADPPSTSSAPEGRPGPSSATSPSTRRTNRESPQGVPRSVQRQPTAAAAKLPAASIHSTTGDLIGRDERLAPWPRTPGSSVSTSPITTPRSRAWTPGRPHPRRPQGERPVRSARSSSYSSDHGLAIGSHGLFGKQNLYDHSMHVRRSSSPGRASKDRRSDALVYLLDIFPTLGELAGVPAPEGSEGKSLAPALTGKETECAIHFSRPTATVQTAVATIAGSSSSTRRSTRRSSSTSKDDPAEIKDLAGDPAHAADVAQLTALLKDWQEARRQAAADDGLSGAGEVRLQQSPAGEAAGRQVNRLPSDAGVGVMSRIPTSPKRERGSRLPRSHFGLVGTAFSGKESAREDTRHEQQMLRRRSAWPAAPGQVVEACGMHRFGKSRRVTIRNGGDHPVDRFGWPTPGKLPTKRIIPSSCSAHDGNIDTGRC